MRRYPYIRCNGDKKRVCLLCNAPYLARNPEEVNTFCPDCSSRTRKRELRIVTANLKRAEKAKVPATLTIKQWLGILDHFNWLCAYCSGPYEVIEHIVSIRVGGGTTALNCVPACIACNTHKDRISTSTTIPIAKIEYVQLQLKEISHDIM